MKKKYTTPTATERNMKVCELRVENDMTLAAIGDYFGLSKQRIQVILERDLDKYINLKRSGR